MSVCPTAPEPARQAIRPARGFFRSCDSSERTSTLVQHDPRQSEAAMGVQQESNLSQD